MTSKKRSTNIWEIKATINDKPVLFIYNIREEDKKSIKIRITRIRSYIAVTNYNFQLIKHNINSNGFYIRRTEPVFMV